MIVDTHAHVWQNADIDSPEIKTMVRASNEYGIDRIFLSGLIGGFVPSVQDVKISNDAVADAIRRYPDIFRGLVYANPRHENKVDVVREYLKNDSFVGIKLWVATLADDPLNFPIIEEAIRQDVPVILHVWNKAVGQLEFESKGDHIANLASRYPESKLIMAHLGGNFCYGIKCIRNFDNVYTDFSGSLCEADALDYTINMIGADRVLFGTDMPGACMTSIAQVEESCISQAEKELIYYKNAFDLFRRLK